MKSDPPGLHRQALQEAVRAGDRRAVARAISLVERDDNAGMQLLDAFAESKALGRAHVVGITGAPGAGKSTLVNALLGELLSRGQRIGVVAVDPSSPLTGGAVLGDRVRMGEHGADERVFIRSVASGAQAGGLSRSTRRIVDVMDAAGFDTVIVETVGAGQSEVDIMNVADTRVVLYPPGLGDSVQSIKAGILEIADILVVSKSDLPGAQVAARDLRDAVHLRAPCAGWQVPVVSTSTGDARSVAALADDIASHALAAGRGRRFATPTRSDAPEATVEAARVRRLFASDAFAQSLGIVLRDAGAGTATVGITLAPRHVNFNGTCHGGVTFALADTAFGLASNSHGVIAAGIDAHITYQLPARVGDTLVARAYEVSRSRSLAVYRVDVTRDGGESLCSFTGTVYVTSRPHASAGAQDTM